MAYVFSQNNLSPLLNQQQGQGGQEQPQRPQTSPKSNFQDPNKLLSKNQNAQQGAVNTAVTGQAQQQFAQNNAQLDKQTKEYQQGQKYQGQAVSDVAGDIQKGGNKLSEILKGPQYQAQQFQPTVTNAIKPGGDYQGQLQKNVKAGRGDFYSQGESALDAALFKNSGAQAKAESQINQMSQQLGQRLNQIPAYQQQATQQGQAAQAQLQAQTKAQVEAYRQQLKNQNAANFMPKYKAEQEEAARQYAQLAQQQKAGLSTQEIIDTLNSKNYYRNVDQYISPELLSQENTIASLLGEQIRSDAGNLDPYIDKAARDADINRLIQSRMLAPPPSGNQGIPQFAPVTAPPTVGPNDPTVTNQQGVTRNAQGQVVTPYTMTDEEYQQQFLGGR
jgi:hypothetical protein